MQVVRPRGFSPLTLDTALALQLLVAWAGEGRSEPARLGWWDTDLCDDAGGGDFFKRLLPHTHAWASLEAAREAGRRIDARARSRFADPDRLRSLFFLGFELDEQLASRLATLKREGRPPAAALLLPLPLSGDFSKADLCAALRGVEVGFTVVPGGRKLGGVIPQAPDELVRQLAAALVPLADDYPLPFYELPRTST